MDALLYAQYNVLSVIAHTMVHALWQHALLALLAALSFALSRRRSAALRHAVGMVFLLAMPLLSALTFWWLRGTPDNSVQLTSTVSVLPTAITVTDSSVWLQTPDWFAFGLSLLWSLGVVFMLLRQLGGWWLVTTMTRHSFGELPMVWQQKMQYLQGTFGISRPVRVALTEDSVSPFTARLFYPVIWLPASLLTQLSAEQLEMVLRHELAHICRFDWLWNGLQCVIESLLFFHPGMWWLSRRIRQEREHACDDMAVAHSGDAIALAEALAALALQRLHRPRLVLAAQGGSLMQRIKHLLSTAPERPRWRTPAALLALLCSTLVLANQVDLIQQKLISLHVDESTDGELKAGDYREINATSSDMQRYYRISLDKDGRVTEIYKENDQVKPIDNTVRTWLADIKTILVIPPPPDVPPPPVLPPPPPPPDIADSKAFTLLFNTSKNDARILAITGSPATLVRNKVGGKIHYPGERALNGKAEFSYVMSGPKGRALVEVTGEGAKGSWTLKTIDVRDEAP